MTQLVRDLKYIVRRSPVTLLTLRTMFIATETTPNPHSMKFLPGKEVLPEAFGTGLVSPSKFPIDLFNRALTEFPLVSFFKPKTKKKLSDPLWPRSYSRRMVLAVAFLEEILLQ